MALASDIPMGDPFRGLRRSPFPDTVDPDVFYPSPIHQGALADLCAALKTRDGLMTLLGEPGSGKTTVLRRASRDLEGTDVRILSCSVAETFEEMLASLCRQLGHVAEGLVGVSRAALIAALTVETRQARSVVVAIDEAQVLGRETLAPLRELAQAARGAAARLAILLVGEPELEARLSELGPLTAIAARVVLPRLPASEVGPYIAFRLREAGVERPDVFSSGAIERVAAYAGGLPRVISQVCDGALRCARETGAQEIALAHVDEAARRLDLRLPGPTPRPTPSPGSPREPRPEPARGRDHLGGAARWRRAGAGLVFAGAGVAALVLATTAYRPAPVSRPAAVPVVGGPTAAAAPSPRRPEPTLAGRPTDSRPPVAFRPAVQPSVVRETLVALPSPPPLRPAASVPSAGPPPSDRVVTPRERALLSAAEAGRLAEVRGLLAGGLSADVRDVYGMTPLMRAVVHDHGDVVRVLVERGAAIEVRDHGGVTALMLAANNDRRALLQTLLARGAPVNARSDAGWTALTYAAWRGHTAVARRLLAAGADPTIADQRGWTPLQYATWRAASLARAEPGPTDSRSPEDPESAVMASLRYGELVALLGGKAGRH